MLDASRLTVLIQEKSGISDPAFGLIVFIRNREIRGCILKADGAHSFLCQGIELALAVFIHHPDLELIPDFVPLINKPVVIRIICGKVCKAVARFGAEKLVSVIDHAVTVFIQCQKPASRPQAVNLILLPVSVQIEQKGLI